MNRNIFTILIVTLITISFASCGDRVTINLYDVPEIPDDITYGVVVGGVRWATRNVGSPGVFALAPESSGSHFIWNGREDYWTEEWTNDTCPQGWRLPTEGEFISLANVPSRWINVNGVSGRLFGTAPNQIFLPAAGLREFFLNGGSNLSEINLRGVYWSNMRRISFDTNMSLMFCRNHTSVFPQHASILDWTGGFAQIRGYWAVSIRCVAE